MRYNPGNRVYHNNLPPQLLRITHSGPSAALIFSAVDGQQNISIFNHVAVSGKHTLLSIFLPNHNNLMRLRQNRTIFLLYRTGPFLFLLRTRQGTGKFNLRAFLSQVKNDFCRSKVYPLGHARNKTGDTIVYQGLDLFRQDLL